MALGPDDVKSIAHLARLAITDNEIEKYTSSLQDILAMVDQMQQIDTDAIEPMAHPLDAHQRLREDEVQELNEREKFQEIAPATEAGLYLVPKVIE